VKKDQLGSVLPRQLWDRLEMNDMRTTKHHPITNTFYNDNTRHELEGLLQFLLYYDDWTNLRISANWESVTTLRFIALNKKKFRKQKSVDIFYELKCMKDNPQWYMTPLPQNICTEY